jgi:uncharacterized membrane protein YpjA
MVWGVVAAVLSGSTAWANCNLIMRAADWRLDWDRLDYQEAPSADMLESWAMRVGAIAVVLSLISLALFFVGATAVADAIR